MREVLVRDMSGHEMTVQVEDDDTDLPHGWVEVKQALKPADKQAAAPVNKARGARSKS